MAERNVYVDTLILTPTLKIYVFFVFQMERWTDGQTDRQTETLIQGGWLT
jgi:hypothetical protein